MPCGLRPVCQTAAMHDSIAAWVEANADRVQARQKAQADAAKLIATFIVAVAASLVAAQLQEKTSAVFDRWSVILLAVSTVLAVMVVLLDRLSEADHLEILEEARLLGWDNETLLGELRLNSVAAARDNEKVLREVRIALLVQFVCAIAGGAVAVAGLLVYA